MVWSQAFWIGWIRWAETLPSLSGLVLERCISPNRDDITATELHVFGDASELGFGAVAYIRFVFSDGSASVRFIISKARVAPLKFLTIPRLELNAAVLAARLGAQLRTEMDITFDRTLYWTDSTTILSWIKSRNCRFNNYVGNRVGEIFESSAPDQWNYVPSASNPADDASRGLDPSEFTVDHRWFTGPPFLQGLEEWPKLKVLPPVEESDPEIRETSWVGLVQRESDEIDLLIERKSRPLIIFNTVAYMFRFIRNARQKNHDLRSTGEFPVDAPNVATPRWFGNGKTQTQKVRLNEPLYCTDGLLIACQQRLTKRHTHEKHK